MSRREESSSSGSKPNRVFVGNLPPDIRTKDVEDLFYKFGDIAFVDLKTRRGPPFAFVEFYDARDAKDAVYSRDGYDYDGYKLRVEFPKGRERSGGRRKSRERESRRGPPTRRTNHRIKVTGLPTTGSWQDLKDHMREAGEVCYADVFRDGTGVVEFMRYEDMKYALKKLDDSKFRSHEGESSYIRVMEDNGRSSGGSRSRSRSRSRSLSPSTKKSRASPTYSPARDSRSRSHSRSRSKSLSRSRSKSPVNNNNDSHRSRSRSHKSRSASRSPSHHSNDAGSRRSSRSRSHSSKSRSPSR